MRLVGKVQGAAVSSRDALTTLLSDGNTKGNFQAGVAQTDIGGGRCSEWANQIGTAPSFTMTQAGNRPLINANGSLYFEGNTRKDFMLCNFTPFTQPITLYFVLNLITWVNGRALSDGNVDGSASFYCNSASPRVSLYAGHSVVCNVDYTLNQVNTVCAVFNGASSVHKFGTGSDVTGNVGSSTPNGVNLNRFHADSSGPDQDIYEVIIRNVADDATTRAAILAKLQAIYGTP